MHLHYINLLQSNQGFELSLLLEIISLDKLTDERKKIFQTNKNSFDDGLGNSLLSEHSLFLNLL